MMTCERGVSSENPPSISNEIAENSTPAPTRMRGSMRPTNRPAIITATMADTPRTACSVPACVGVYPCSDCRNDGSSTLGLRMDSPMTNISVTAMRKLRSRNSVGSTNACLVVTECTTNMKPRTAAKKPSATTSVDWNQSSVWPRSIMSWNSPSVSDSSAKPVQSNGRLWSSCSAASPSSSPKYASSPIGTLMKNAQRQLSVSVR